MYDLYFILMMYSAIEDVKEWQHLGIITEVGQSYSASSLQIVVIEL